MLEAEHKATFVEDIRLQKVCPGALAVAPSPARKKSSVAAVRKLSRWSTSSTEQIEAYLDRMFGRREGTVVLALGGAGYFNEHEKYRTRGWSPHPYVWPAERQRFINDAVRAASSSDVYVLVTLRFGPEPARKGSSLGSEYCWADLDSVSEDTPGRLATLLSEGSFLVHSGQRRHLHVYIKLDAIYPADVIEELNKGLRQYLKADRKWAENTVLRLPGTLNHKGRAAGGKSYPVVFEDIRDAQIAPWAPSKLIGVLGPLAEPVRSYSPSRRPKGPKTVSQPKMRTRAEIAPVNPEAISDEMTERILRQLTKPNLFPRGGGDRTRSGQLHRLVAGIMKLGHRDGVIMAVVQNYGPAKAKWDDEELRRRDIQRCINKLRRVHPHIGQTCVEANCQGNANRRLAAEIDAIRSHFESNYQSKTGSTDSKILNALLQRASEVRRLEVGVSLRMFCESASIGSLNTLRKGLDRLAQAGYVEKVLMANGDPLRTGEGPRQRRAHCYRAMLPVYGEELQDNIEGNESSYIDHSHVDNPDTLNHRKIFFCGNRGSTPERTAVGSKPPDHNPNAVSGNRNQQPMNDERSLLDPQLDMWRFKGLGSTYRTYEQLSLGSTKVKAIAEASNRDPQTIRRHLKKLEHHGLAQRLSGHAWVALHRDPNDVAKELGTMGMGKEQAERYARESELFQSYVDMRDEEDQRRFDELEALGHYWDGYKLVPPNRRPTKRTSKQPGPSSGK